MRYYFIVFILTIGNLLWGTEKTNISKIFQNLNSLKFNTISFNYSCDQTIEKKTADGQVLTDKYKSFNRIYITLSPLEYYHISDSYKLINGEYTLIERMVQSVLKNETKVLSIYPFFTPNKLPHKDSMPASFCKLEDCITQSYGYIQNFADPILPGIMWQFGIILSNLEFRFYGDLIDRANIKSKEIGGESFYIEDKCGMQFKSDTLLLSKIKCPADNFYIEFLGYLPISGRQFPYFTKTGNESTDGDIQRCVYKIDPKSVRFDNKETFSLHFPPGCRVYDVEKKKDYVVSKADNSSAKEDSILDIPEITVKRAKNQAENAESN